MLTSRSLNFLYNKLDIVSIRVLNGFEGIAFEKTRGQKSDTDKKFFEHEINKIVGFS